MTDTPRKRGRPPKQVPATPVTAPPLTDTPLTATPVTDTPRKRGRPPKQVTATPLTAPPLPDAPLLSGVQGVVAHRPLSVLEVQDSADLDALLLDARVAGQVVSRLAPTFALLTPGSEKTVLEALRRVGQTPRVVGG